MIAKDDEFERLIKAMFWAQMSGKFGEDTKKSANTEIPTVPRETKEKS